MKSRAAILFEVGRKLEVHEVDVQDPGPDEVRIRMVAGGVCHSDLHVMTGHLSAPCAGPQPWGYGAVPEMALDAARPQGESGSSIQYCR